MNHNRRRGSGGGSIPSLLDIPNSSAGNQSTGYGSSGFGSNQSSDLGSGGFNSQGFGSFGNQTLGSSTYKGMSQADIFSRPVGYGSNFSQFSSGSSGLISNTSSGVGSNFGSRNNGDGLLGSGLRSSSSSSFGSGLGGGLGSGLGGDQSFAAKVRLQQAMLAEERQKSVQQQIQEQLELQNRKRLEYNRMKRDRENRRRDDRRRDDRGRHDDRRRDRGGSKEGQEAGGLDDVHVTIKARSEGRAVSDNTGGAGRKRNLSDRSRSQQGDQDAKRATGEDNKNGGDAKQQGPWKCHVCVVTCRDLKGYEMHMKGRKHSEAMEKMRLVTEFQAQQAVKRLEAENHLKKVQGRRTTDEDEHYCRDCLTHYTGHFLLHRRTKEHKEARRTQRPHCRVCNVTFKTPKKYVAHCNTPGHKKVYEAAKNKGDKDIDEENFVTVDSVGVCDDENVDDEALLAANMDDADSKVEDNMQTNLGEGFDTTIMVTKATSEDDVVIIDSDSEAPQMPQASSDPNAQTLCESASDVFASSADESTIDDLVTAQLVSESDSMIPEDSASSKPSDEQLKTPSPEKKKKKMKKPENHDENLSEYDPNKPVGRHHVIPVWGYFCKPCRKFYQSVGSQGSVLEAHCKTLEHFNAVKFIMAQGDDVKDDEDDTEYLSLAIAQDQELASKDKETASQDPEMTSQDPEMTSQDSEMTSQDQEMASEDQEMTN